MPTFLYEEASQIKLRLEPHGHRRPTTDMWIGLLAEQYLGSRDLVVIITLRKDQCMDLGQATCILN